MSESDNNYPYYANILTPAQLGMSAGSSLRNIEDGVAGLVNYIKLLVILQRGLFYTLFIFYNNLDIYFLIYDFNIYYELL